MSTYYSAAAGNWNDAATWGAIWLASTAYALADYVIPTTPNGYVYECTVAGTSGTTEPTWPTTEGGTVTDGGVTWTCRSTPDANGDVENIGHEVTYNLGDSTVTFGNITINSGGVLIFPTAANSTLYIGDTGGSNNAVLTINSGGELRIGTSTTPIGAAYHARIYFQRSAAGNSLVLNDGGILNIYGDTAYYGSTIDDRYAELDSDWTSGQTLYVKGDYSSKWQSGQKFWIHKNGHYTSYTADADIYTIDSVGTYDSVNDRTPITILEAAPGIIYSAMYATHQSEIVLVSRNVELADPNSSWDVSGYNSYTEVARLSVSQSTANRSVHLENCVIRGCERGTSGGNNVIYRSVVILNCNYGFRSVKYADFVGDLVSHNVGSYLGEGCKLEGRMLSANSGLYKGVANYFVGSLVSCNSAFSGEQATLMVGDGVACQHVMEKSVRSLLLGDAIGCNSLLTQCRFCRMNGDVRASSGSIGETVGVEKYSAVLEDCLVDGANRRDIRIYENCGSFLPLVSGDTDWQTPPSGMSWILEVTPNSYADAYYSQILELCPLDADRMAQYLDTSGSHTITFKIYPVGWTALDQDDIYLEAWYLDSASGITRSKAVTGTASFSNGSWQSLSVTFTAGQAGIVYFNLKIAKYESGAYALIDPQPTVS